MTGRLFVECGEIRLLRCGGCGNTSVVQTEVYVLDADSGDIEPVGPFLACIRCEPDQFPPGMFEGGPGA